VTAHRPHRLGRAPPSVIAIAAVIFALAACGDDGGSAGTEVEGRGTYTLIEATTAGTGDDLAAALGAEQGVGGQYQDPAIGRYVIVEVSIDSAGEESSEEDSPIVLVDGEGETHEVGLGQVGVGDPGEDESLNFTYVFDVPTEAIPGSVLRFGKPGAAETMELGL
jgi:hypothetical protein